MHGGAIIIPENSNENCEQPRPTTPYFETAASPAKNLQEKSYFLFRNQTKYD
jgi:hypothetical protein